MAPNGRRLALNRSIYCPIVGDCFVEQSIETLVSQLITSDLFTRQPVFNDILLNYTFAELR